MTDIKIKYNTIACDFYRRRLDANAKMEAFDEVAPSYEDGRRLLDGSRIVDDENNPEFLQSEENSVIESVMIADNLLTDEECKEESKNESSFYMISDEDRKEAIEDGNVSDDEEIMDKVKLGVVSVVKSLKDGVKRVYSKLESSEAR